MKKGVLIALMAILIIGLGIISFYPVTQNSTVEIDATFDNTVLQVMHVENWKNWFPEIKEAYRKNPLSYRMETDSSKKVFTILIPGRKFIIHAISPVSYKVNEIRDDLENNFAFTLFPVSTHSISLHLVEKRPLLGKLMGGDNRPVSPLAGLKSYLEDPKQLYGYDIEVSKIRDPLIASLHFITRKKDLFEDIKNSYLSLTRYVAENHLVKMGHLSISYAPGRQDSLSVTVGIPVNLHGAPDNRIKCLTLPVGGKVLTGIYTGKFSQRDKVYDAMSRYLTDHTFAIPAESFERYLNDSIPRSDSDVIRIELNYPIY